THALEVLGQVAQGVNPKAAPPAAEPTARELADPYFREYAEQHKKPRSVEEDRRNFAKHILPAVGDRRVVDLDRQDALKLHHKLRSTPVAANRVAALGHKMFELAEDWGLRAEGTNPWRRLKTYRERPRERFLTADEIRRVGDELNRADRRADHSTEIAIIRLLLLTGARLGEILCLCWSLVDFERGAARLPDS